MKSTQKKKEKLNYPALVEKQLKESHERFFAVLEGINAGVYAADLVTYEIIYANKYMRDLFGDIVGQPCWKSLQAGQNSPCEFCRIDELLKSGVVHEETCAWEQENTVTGRWLYIQDRAIPWVDGRTVRLSVITDITQRKMVEKELSDAKERAEEATRLKDKFISLVAHDLRSPFAWIMGFLKKMLNDQAHPLHETHRDLVRRILDGGESMVNMIDSLLKISRLQSGKIALTLQFTEMNMPIRSVLHNFLPLAEKKGIVLSNEIPDGKRFYVDKELFSVVMQNLVSNAIKFCREGDRVTIFAPEGERTTIAVKDTGLGIDEKVFKDIFKHEEKTSTPGTAGEAGTGLGLPLCLDIMAAHGGSIWAESKAGEGSVFYVEFPSVKPIVLLVEDAKTTRLLFRRSLERLDVEVLEAENGEAALGIMEKTTPHLIITDLFMPVMDGFELMRRVHRNPRTKSIPIIVITSDAEMETREKAVRSGADDFILKTADVEEFLPRVLKFVA